MKEQIKFVAFLLAVSAALLIAKPSSAQSRAEALRLGVGVDLGVPVTKNTADVVVGPSLRLQWDFPKRTSLTLTGAYEAFLGKEEIDGTDVDYIADQIPVKFGAKFFFGQTYTFYVQPELGASFSAKKDYGNAVVYSGGLGYVSKKGFDLALRYEGYEFGESNSISSKERFGLVALRVAYGFKLR